ncbi:MAG: TonB-dependent receptor, partial [Gammaproteobacteria bacterium]|nr:TonB-dependent receptor [Gammaproteobacteria bacterium]
RGVKDFEGGNSLVFVTSYREWDSQQKQHNDEHGGTYSIFANQPEIQKTTDIEVRLISPTGQFWEYLVGVYAHFRDSEFIQQSQLLAPGCLYSRNTEGRVNSGAIADTTEARSGCVGWWRNDFWQQDTTSYAGFGQVTANVTDAWSLIGGLRVTRDDKDAFKTVRNFGPDTPQNGFGASFGTNAFDDQVDNTETTWAFSARYLPTGDGDSAGRFMTFGRVAKGYKSPGINARPIRFAVIPTKFGPEESLNYEVGFKSTWLDQRATFNVTLFYSEFKELQQIVSNPASDPTGALGTFVQNAGELEHKGVEIEYDALATDWLRFFGALTYLDSEFKDFDGTVCPQLGDVPASVANPALCDQTGLPNIRTPKWRMNHSVEVSGLFAGTGYGWFGRLSGIWVDDHYVSADRDFRSFQESFWIWNMSAGINSASGKWRAQFWMKNMDNEFWKRGIGNGAVPGNQGIRGSKVAYFGPPRTLGLEFIMTFD